MIKPVLAALLILALAGCGSGGGHIPSGETYAGQLVATVLPVTGNGIYIGEGIRLQRQLGQVIADSDTFADVLLPGSASDGHEGEVVIRANVRELSKSDGGRIELNLRALRKTTGEVGLDRTYKGRCRNCASDPVGGALADVAKAINRDLRKRYREPAVF